MVKNVKVNEKERTVKVQLTNCKNDAIDFITQKNPSLGLYARLCGVATMKNTFVGTAVCSESDTFDEYTGIVVAMRRARENYNRSMFKAFNRFARKLCIQTDNLLDEIDSFGAKLTKNCKYNAKHVEELTNKE